MKVSVALRTLSEIADRAATEEERLWICDAVATLGAALKLETVEKIAAVQTLTLAAITTAGILRASEDQQLKWRALIAPPNGKDGQ